MTDGMHEGYLDLAHHMGWVACTECGQWADMHTMVVVDGWHYCAGTCANEAPRENPPYEYRAQMPAYQTQAELRETYSHPRDCACPACSGDAEEWAEDAAAAEMERMEYGSNTCRLDLINRRPEYFNPAAEYQYDDDSGDEAPYPQIGSLTDPAPEDF